MDHFPWSVPSSYHSFCLVSFLAHFPFASISLIQFTYFPYSFYVLSRSTLRVESLKDLWIYSLHDSFTQVINFDSTPLSTQKNTYFWYTNLGNIFRVTRGARVECGRDFQSAAHLRWSSQWASRRCKQGATHHEYSITIYMYIFIIILAIIICSNLAPNCRRSLILIHLSKIAEIHYMSMAKTSER
jgi:hypothetical protein